MPITNEELNNIADRLERSYTQVGSLQTRLEMTQQLADKDNQIAQLNDALNRERDARLKAETENLEKDKEIARLKQLVDSSLATNARLTDGLFLSIKLFSTLFNKVRHFELKSLIYAFIAKTISPELEPNGLEKLNKITELSDHPDLEKLADQLILGNEGGQVIHE